MLKDLLRRFKKHEPEEAWPSLVLLLKEYRPLPDAKLLELADKCYSMSGPNGRISPEIISNSEAGRVLRVQSFFIHVPEANKRYEIGGRESSEIRQRAWDGHTAWRSVDFPKQQSSNSLQRNEQYNVILFLLTHLW